MSVKICSLGEYQGLVTIRACDSMRAALNGEESPFQAIKRVHRHGGTPAIAAVVVALDRRAIWMEHPTEDLGHRFLLNFCPFCGEAIGDQA